MTDLINSFFDVKSRGDRGTKTELRLFWKMEEFVNVIVALGLKDDKVEVTTRKRKRIPRQEETEVIVYYIDSKVKWSRLMSFSEVADVQRERWTEKCVQTGQVRDVVPLTLLDVAGDESDCITGEA